MSKSICLSTVCPHLFKVKKYVKKTKVYIIDSMDNNKQWEDLHELWDFCLKEIEKDISRANFNTWFKNTAILKNEQGTVYIAVPNEFVKEWLGKKFHKNILKAIVGVIGIPGVQL